MAMFAEKDGKYPWGLAPYFAVMMPGLTFAWDWIWPGAEIKSIAFYGLMGLSMGLVTLGIMYLEYRGWLRGTFHDPKKTEQEQQAIARRSAKAVERLRSQSRSANVEN